MRSNKAVLGLPLRLVVGIIVGGVALSAVLYYLASPCIFPKELSVNWSPISIPNEEKTPITVIVRLNGKNVDGAIVIINGLGNISYNKTINGKATLYFTPHMKGRYEGYLSLTVKGNGCYRRFYEEKAIKVFNKE